MTGQQLKNSILQMAVQGKLVPQDPNDEPAAVLLERIRKEKEQLIKDGKIKKEKNPSYIFRGADNLPYEKVGKNEPVCIADEVPFEIPESWEWVRISTIFTLQAGKNIKAADIFETNFDGSYLCYGGNGIRGYVKSYNREGPYPIIGRQGALCGNIKYAKGKFYATEHAVCVETFAQTNVKWACAFLEALNLNQYATATAQPGLAVANINTVLIPLPPKNEQQRIVDSLFSLQPFIKAYAKKIYELNFLNQQFSELLKKSILQEAVKGKLVPQNPSDEPAFVLLERIRAEKERLIQEGKIKRNKYESVIYRRDNSHYEKLDGIERCIDDEIPFEIPDSWEWVRLGTISTYSYTKQKINAQNVDPKIWGLDLEDIEKGGRLLTKKSVGERKAVGDKTFFDKGDILYSKLRPYLLKILIASDCGICTPEIVPFKVFGKINPEYIVAFLKCPYVDVVINSVTYGVKMPRVGTETMTNLFVPIPPLSEQYRIVEKQKELFDKISLM